MKFKNLILFLFAVTIAFPWACVAQSNDPLADLFSEEPEFLLVDEAFQFDFSQNGDQLTLSFDIADGYYLYKKQFKTVTKNAEIGEPSYPESVTVEDEFFEEPQEVFYKRVDIQYPIIQSVKDGVVKLQFQGCAEAGLCYPPTVKVVYLEEVKGSGSVSVASDATSSQGSGVSEQFELAGLLTSDKSLILILLAFVALGIGLAFTPCVFPMYPILSGIVIGQGKSIKTSHAFTLSFIYVQGMAITYSLLGLVVASAGVQFQAMLQHPAILIVLIVLFVLLAMAMFGTWELQLPSSWQVKLNNLSNQQKSGSFAGVFFMGVISGLVASPCTTAPLTAILLVIAQEGDLLLGFSALYALSIGMGIPLILFGVTGGKLLPKAGAWMNIVKVTFGFMMLAVALMFIERVIIHPYTDLAWAALGLAAFTYFFVMNQNAEATFWKGVRALVIFIGLFGSAMYGYNTIQPSQGHHAAVTDGASNNGAAHASSKGHPKFLIVKDLTDFRVKLAEANAEGKTVMVDLYADWCVACKEFEKYTFPDPEVVAALSDTVWMQIDLTDNTPINYEFQEEFSVLGLPTIMFFDTQGNELSSARITGFMRAQPFAEHVRTILK